jgi:hypothetical protein
VTHAASGGAVLFGGLSATGAPLQDTWLWSNGGWTQLAGLPVSPPAGECFAASGPLGFDPFVLSDGQVWQFDGTWNLFATVPPGPSSWLVGVTPSGAPILTSKSNSSHPSFEWVAGSWVARPAVGRYIDTMAFDPRSGETIGFDRAERFVYTATPAAATTVGTPCGAPAPRIYPEALPVLGASTMRVDADGVQGLVAFFGGFGPANAPIGNGCSVYIANPFAIGLALANVNGVVSLPLPIPFAPSLLGADVHLQVASPQPATPPIGLALSSGLTLTLGY